MPYAVCCMHNAKHIYGIKYAFVIVIAGAVAISLEFDIQESAGECVLIILNTIC